MQDKFNVILPPRMHDRLRATVLLRWYVVSGGRGGEAFVCDAHGFAWVQPQLLLCVWATPRQVAS